MTKVSPYLRRISTICITLCLLVLCLLIWQNSQQQTSTLANDGGFTLQPPVFLKSAYAQNSSFLTEEAGITAYVNVGKAIDLDRVKRINTLRSITKQTEEYVSGSMIAPGYDEIAQLQEEFDIQIFIHRDGWILAYLLREQYASLLIDWANYGENHLNVTTLENSVRHIMSKVGSVSGDIAYYDFRHPDATHLMLIADHEVQRDATDSFSIKIPTDFDLYESSWSHFGYKPYKTRCSLNNNLLSEYTDRNDWFFRYDQIDSFELQTGKLENIELYHYRGLPGSNSSWSACGFTLIYKEN